MPPALTGFFPRKEATLLGGPRGAVFFLHACLLEGSTAFLTVTPEVGKSAAPAPVRSLT